MYIIYMDAGATEKEPKRPPPQQVEELMRLYPLLDQFMCELILSCTEEELGELLSQTKETNAEEMLSAEEINVSY